MALNIIILILVCTLSSSHQTDSSEQEYTLQITDQNFNTYVAHFNYLLVEFYAPWCGHCQRLKPDFVKAAAELYNNHTEPYVALGMVDCTVETRICTTLNITSYPTLKFFINRDDFAYSGGRETSEIIYWVNKKISGSTFEVSNDEELTQHTTHNPLTVVYFSNSIVTTSSFQAFAQTAASFPNILFLHSYSDPLKQEYSPENQVALFAHHLQNIVYYPASLDITDKGLIIFIESNRYPRIMNFTLDSASLIFEGKKPALFLFYFDDKEQKNMLEAKEQFSEVGKQFHQDQLLMVLANLNDQPSLRLANLLAIQQEDLPAIKIIKPDGDTAEDLKKYSFDETQVKTQKIVNFVTRYFDNKIQPIYQSAELPEKDYEDTIRVLVSHNYEHIINDVTKDILVFFYVPWCGHCKTLLPTLINLSGQIRSGVKGVKPSEFLIGKIDVTQNEIPNLKIEIYPSLYLFPANNKQQPIKYDGDRTQEGLLKWINEHGSFQPQKQQKQQDL